MYGFLIVAPLGASATPARLSLGKRDPLAKYINECVHHPLTLHPELCLSSLPNQVRKETFVFLSVKK